MKCTDEDCWLYLSVRRDREPADRLGGITGIDRLMLCYLNNLMVSIPMYQVWSVKQTGDMELVRCHDLGGQHACFCDPNGPQYKRSAVGLGLQENKVKPYKTGVIIACLTVSTWA